MRRIALFAALLVATACTSPFQRGGADDKSFAAAYHAVFRSDELCAASYKYDWWCPAATYPGAGFQLPTSDTTLLGVSAFIGKDQRASDALFQQSSLSMLHLGPQGAALAYINPDDGDASELDAAIHAYIGVARVLTGQAREIVVSEDLESLLDADRRARARHALRLDDAQGRWDGALPARVWESDGRWGKALVVLESGNDGVYISVFPRVPRRVTATQDTAGDADELGAASQAMRGRIRASAATMARLRTRQPVQSTSPTHAERPAGRTTHHAPARAHKGR